MAGPLTADQIVRARAAAIAAGLPELHRIIHAVCDAMGADVAAVKAHGKGDHVVMAAREQVVLCAREAGFSYSQIGRVMSRDHTTIMAAVRRLARRGNNG